MNRKVVAKIVAGLLISSALVADGPAAYGDWNDFWHSVHVDYHRNNQWPHPFRAMDAQSVATPFEIMKNNGWRAYNTIGEPLFDPATNNLTAAGRRQVQWILTQAPQHRRVVFVLKSDSPEKTAERIAAVQAVAAELQPGSPPPGVYVTDIKPHRSSGTYQTAISRSLMESIPEPRLPNTTGLSTPNAGASSGNGN